MVFIVKVQFGRSFYVIEICGFSQSISYKNKKNFLLSVDLLLNR